MEMCVVTDARVHTVVMEALKGISVPLAPLPIAGSPYTFFHTRHNFCV